MSAHGVIHAVPNWGPPIVLYSAHPRKELMERLGLNPRGGARKVYRDTDHGTKHVGYVLASRWWTFYTVTPWEQAA